MLHFGMNLPFYLMALYGSIMILMVLILRALLKNRLPKFVFPILWSFVMLRFLVPFSISIPLSIPVPVNPYGTNIAEAVTSLIVVEQDPMASEVNVLPGLMQISSDAVSATETTMAYGSSASAAFTPFAWKKILPFVYVLGVLTTAGILGWQKYGYSKKLQNGLLVEHNETINTLLRDMGMGHVLVFTSDGIATPLVCGLLNPRIYLPTQMDFQNTVLLRHD